MSELARCKRRLAYYTAIMGKLYDAIYNRIEEKERNLVLKEAGRACAMTAMRGPYRRVEINTDLDLDSYLSNIIRVEPPGSTIERKGNIIIYKANTQGKCLCPLIRHNVIKPNPKLCVCSANFAKTMIEANTKEPVEVEKVEIVESVLRGGQSCTVKAHFKGRPS